MKLDEIITVLAATGTGQRKLEDIQSLLKGAKLSPESVAAKLTGKIPSGTIDKIQNMLIHGTAELIEPDKLDASQLASKAEVAGFRAAFSEMGEVVNKLGEKIAEMAKELAYEKSEREKLTARLESLESKDDSKKGAPEQTQAK
ncbi:MAG: hypothetical protein ACIALR_05485 [Blastopirellula sp. JB062]